MSSHKPYTVGPKGRWGVGALALVGVLAGCQGDIIPPGGGPTGPMAAEIEPAPETRFARLTHREWRNAVVDLLGFPPDVDATEVLGSFRPDPTNAGYLFDNNGQTMLVDDALWGAYQRAAAEAARRACANPAIILALAPEEEDESARVLGSLTRLGQRAYRRPLREGELDDLHAIYELGRDAYDDQSGFGAGLRLVIDTVLQSPFFLYRVEESAEIDGGQISLTNHEIAARLSFALWDTMPDEELFQAAIEGQLSGAEGLRRQAERMLDDPRSVAVVMSFHAQLLEAESVLGVVPSEAFYPDAPADLGSLAVREHELVIENAYRDGEGFGDLLTQTHTYANEALAAVYGVDGGRGEEFTRVELNPEERRGIFTQVGFLAANATSVEPDPIHRGVFIAERLACITIGAPPGIIPPLPVPMGRTNRETIEAHTQTPGSVCASCHTTLINPFGFPFEHYDAIGSWRDEDRGFPIDAASSPLLGGTATPVMNAIELAEAMSESAAIHDCYAEHWIQYAFGRPAAAHDEGLRTTLGHRSRSGVSIRDMILELVLSDAFVTRNAEELP